jgi:hypothetical protein
MQLSSIVILLSVVGKPILAIPVPVEYPYGIDKDGFDAMAEAYRRLPGQAELPVPGCEYRNDK